MSEGNRFIVQMDEEKTSENSISVEMYDVNVGEDMDDDAWLYCRLSDENQEVHVQSDALAYYEGHAEGDKEDDGNIYVANDVQPLNDIDSDQLVSLVSSDESKGQYWSVPSYSTAGDNLELHVGMKFVSHKEFKEYVVSYALKGGWNIKFTKSASWRVTAVCQEGCPWRIHASNMQGEETFQIKTLKGNHTCSRTLNNKLVNSKWLSNNYFNEFRENPKMKLRDFQAKVKKDLIVGISRTQAYRARAKANARMVGDVAGQYSKLWDYCAEIMRTNPGSSCRLKINKDSEKCVFQRAYFCLAACKEGFKAGCIPFIGLDGTFLKGGYGGQLLSAVGRDPNRQMFPIAYAVVESENKDSWTWFLQYLKDDVGYTNEEKKFTFMSDQQKGLVPALEELMPDAEHRFCVRHLHANFGKLYRGQKFKELLWNAARATNTPDFMARMNNLKNANKKAAEWLLKLDPKHWCRHAFREDIKCDWLTNNMSEAFNSYIWESREKPIIAMLEDIRQKLMVRFTTNRETMRRYGKVICPFPLQKLEQMKVDSRTSLPTWAGGDLFEVEDYPNRYVVNLGNHTCSCRKWNICGIPCGHAVSCILYMKQDPEDYMDPCYQRVAYMRVYEHVISPLSGPYFWTKTSFEVLYPPPYKKPIGRPKKLRRKDPIERENVGGTNSRGSRGPTVRCKNCWEWGHNRRTCKKVPMSKPKSWRIGRDCGMTETEFGGTQPPSSGINITAAIGIDTADAHGIDTSIEVPPASTIPSEHEISTSADMQSIIQRGSQGRVGVTRGYGRVRGRRGL